MSSSFVYTDAYKGAHRYGEYVPPDDDGEWLDLDDGPAVWVTTAEFDAMHARGLIRHLLISPYQYKGEPVPANVTAFLATLGARTPEELDSIIRQLTEESPEPGEPRKSYARPKEPSRYGQRALEGEVGRVLLAPVGARNHTLNRAAFSLGQLVGAGELDERTVAEALYMAGTRAGLGEKEIIATVASGMSSGLAKPRSS